MNIKPGTLLTHFNLEQLTDNVLVAIHKDGGGAICNAVIIDLGGLVLVYDTFLTPQAAADLRKTALEHFACPPHLVILSHYHNDHIWGCQVFAGESQILSSTGTRHLITTEGMEEFKYYSEHSASKLKAIQDRLAKSGKQDNDEDLLWIGYYEGLVQALPALSVCLPTITFDDRLELHGSMLTAELMTFSGAHSGSDTVLYLPGLNIALLSDLLFVDCHPYLAEGDPLIVKKALQDMLSLDATHYIPGHGPVGTAGDLHALIRYIDHCEETAQVLVKGGEVPESQVTNLLIPEEFSGWRFPGFFQTNIKAMCKHLSAAG